MRNMVTKKDLLSFNEAQQILNVDKKSLYKFIRSGKLTTRKIGHEVQIDNKSLKALLNCSRKPEEEQYLFHETISNSEIQMISEWT